ncbi:MAG: Gfo/Idh/MocA family oxidoreductase [Verrucomicrobia bacterium]|nr:Gfo/Idh/MocA family oxidoreductase [Verrucomicrobiota bacterium]
MKHPTAPAHTPPALTRRQFLARSASAGAFTVVSASSIRSSEANTRVRVGSVGLGGRGAWIAEHVAQHAGFEITAVADYFPAVAEAVGERLSVPKERRFSGLSGARRLLESKVEAVFLETPPFFFPAHAQAAVAAGCHVYMAKPVAVDVPGCLAILEAGQRATRNSQVFLVDFQTRTDPFHQEALRRVHQGMLGRLGLLTAFYHDECFRDPPPERTIENLLRGLAWVNDTSLGGSYIVNCDIHAVDVALWIAQDVPSSAVGYSFRNRPDAHGDSHDCYAISYEFQSGLVMTNQSEHVRNATEFKSGCFAYGQRGWLEAHYGGKTAIRGLDDGFAGGEANDLYADGMRRNVDAFHRSIVGRDFTNPTLAPSVNSTLATILGREAALKGRRLTWTDLLADRHRIEPDLTGLRA